MKIEIKTYEKSLAFDVLGKKSVSLNDEVAMPGNAKLTCLEMQN